MQTPAVCETLLTTGQQCGVAAIGRCTTCGRAFCQTHQARGKVYGGSVPYVDLCANCFAQTPEEVARRKEEEAYTQLSAVKNYIYSGSARADLLKNGVPPYQFYKVSSEWQGPTKGFFGTNIGVGRNIDVRIPTIRGWILGQFKWRQRHSFEDSRTFERDCLTALLDVDPKNHGDFVHFGTAGGLAVVEGSPEAYQLREANETTNAFIGSWEEVVQTVKRLAGVTS